MNHEPGGLQPPVTHVQFPPFRAALWIRVTIGAAPMVLASMVRKVGDVTYEINPSCDPFLGRLKF